jgi:hypothetical protein
MRHNLEIRWTVSRGRETEGWNICTLWQQNTRIAKTCGGGYDMTGTVFANFLNEFYFDLIKEKVKPEGVEGGMYGLFNRNGSWYLDGRCGLDCMVEIAKLAGLKVQYVYGKNVLTNLIVESEA